MLLSFITAGILVCALMCLLWHRQNLSGKADIVDFGWAVSIGLAAAIYGILGTGYLCRRLLIMALVLSWSFRLARHLWYDRVSKAGEDGRYQTLRQSWGKNASRNFFIFFQAQALLAVFLSLPFLCIAYNPAPMLSSGELAGILLWIAAVFGEHTADAQLAAFKDNKENKGKTCRSGLWRYSRHPNYFFEWLHWFSYFLMSLGFWYWWVSLLIMLTMLWLITSVTGIPPTEARALQSRGDDYRRYQQETSPFFPWFQKKGTL